MKYTVVFLFTLLTLLNCHIVAQDKQSSFPSEDILEEKQFVFAYPDRFIIFLNTVTGFRLLTVERKNLQLLDDIFIEKKPNDFRNLVFKIQFLTDDRINILAATSMESIWYWISIDLNTLDYTKKKLDKGIIPSGAKWSKIEDFPSTRSYFLLFAHKKTDEIQVVKFEADGTISKQISNTGISKLHKRLSNGNQGYKHIFRIAGFFFTGADIFPNLGTSNSNLFGSTQARYSVLIPIIYDDYQNHETLLFKLDPSSLKINIDKIGLSKTAIEKKFGSILYLRVGSSEFYLQLMSGKNYQRLGIIDSKLNEELDFVEIQDEKTFNDFWGQQYTYLTDLDSSILSDNKSIFRKINFSLTYSITNIDANSYILTIYRNQFNPARKSSEITFHQIELTTEGESIQISPIENNIWDLPQFDFSKFYKEKNFEYYSSGWGSPELLGVFAVESSIYCLYKHKKQIHIAQFDLNNYSY